MTTAATSANSDLLSVPILPQFPDYPTGCETISAIMVLRYYGEDIAVTDFIDNHLLKDSTFYWKDGEKYGPDPSKVFVGSPTSTQSYGCMEPVIRNALASYFGSDERLVTTTGQTMAQLCDAYVSKGVPVLVWVTIGMIETGKGDHWKLEDGTDYYWPLNEHCMVLVGSNDTHYFFNDPYRGTVKKYPKYLCERRYKDLGMQSLAVLGK